MQYATCSGDAEFHQVAQCHRLLCKYLEAVREVEADQVEVGQVVRVVVLGLVVAENDLFVQIIPA